MSRRYRRPPFLPRPQAPNSAIEEGRQLAGLSELPEDLLRERAPRPPILTPRGNPTDNPFGQMPAPVTIPGSRNFWPQKAQTFPPIIVPALVPTQLLAATRERAYCITINSGANAAVITYGRVPAGATDGIPLAAAGVGFHELIHGTTDTLWAFSTAGTEIIVTEARYDPEMGA